MEGPTIACVGAVVRDDRGRLLLVRRANEPGRGQWSVPGGRVEPGETAHQALVREVHEETRLTVAPDALAGVVERSAPGGGVYVVEDFFARLRPGTDPRSARAGDDADEVGWFTPDQVVELDCVDGLVEALRQWRVLAR
jgi:8-oxo-dGTP diphosphatase